MLTRKPKESDIPAPRRRVVRDPYVALLDWLSSMSRKPGYATAYQKVGEFCVQVSRRGGIEAVKVKPLGNIPETLGPRPGDASPKVDARPNTGGNCDQRKRYRYSVNDRPSPKRSKNGRGWWQLESIPARKKFHSGISGSDPWMALELDRNDAGWLMVDQEDEPNGILGSRVWLTSPEQLNEIVRYARKELGWKVEAK